MVSRSASRFTGLWLTGLRPACTNVMVTATSAVRASTSTMTPTLTPTSATTTTTTKPSTTLKTSTTSTNPSPTLTTPVGVDDCASLSNPYDPGYLNNSYTLYCNSRCNTGRPPAFTTTQQTFSACIKYCDAGFELEVQYEAATGLCQCDGSINNSIEGNQEGRSCAVVKCAARRLTIAASSGPTGPASR